MYGGVGTGKTYLATLLSLNAIHRFGKPVKFYTVASLVNKLIEANQNGSLAKLMKQIEKLDLLVLDELGYIPLNKEGAELLFQVISMCYGEEEHRDNHKSTIWSMESRIWRSCPNRSSN